MKEETTFLHILPARAGETLELVRELERRQEKGQHRYLVLIPRLTVIKQIPELLSVPAIDYAPIPKGRFGKLKKLTWLTGQMKRAKHIFLHGLNIGDGLLVLALSLHPKLCKKAVWVENIDDVANWEQHKGRLLGRIWTRLHQKVRQRIPAVGIPFGAEEQNILERWPEKRVYTLPYPLPKGIEGPLREIAAQRGQRDYAPVRTWIEEHAGKAPDFRSWLEIELPPPEDGESEAEEDAGPDPELPNIQIGFTSQRFNRHDLVMRVLKNYYDFPQNVCLPANYIIRNWSAPSGTRAYISSMQKLGEGFWREKFRLLVGSVTSREYLDYLRTLDVAVLGGKNCVNVTYLLLLLGAGVKLYFPQKSYPYLFLRSCGAAVHSLEEIEELEFLDFVSSDGPAELPESLQWYYDRDQVMAAWLNLFRDLQEK